MRTFKNLNIVLTQKQTRMRTDADANDWWQHKLSRSKIQDGRQSRHVENQFSTSNLKPLVDLTETCSVATGRLQDGS